MNAAWAQLIPLVLIVAVFWMLILRPARKRQSAMNQLQSSLQPGAEVMLNSGIFGTVESLDDEAIQLRVAEGSTLRVHRKAVANVVEPTVQTSTDGEAASGSTATGSGA